GYLSWGNREDPAHPSFLIGAIDEIQLLDRIWDPATIDTVFFAGADGMCPLAQALLFVPGASAAYGDAAAVVQAQLLRIPDQQPLAGKAVRLVSRVSAGGSIVGMATLLTDANGIVQWNAPMASATPAGSYATGIEA